MTSELLVMQWKFFVMVGNLIREIDRLGYHATFGDAYRDPRVPYGHRRSLHRSRLALDINLYTKDGEYITDSEAYRAVGEYWESIGGTWGGRFQDGNHFSLSYDGMK